MVRETSRKIKKKNIKMPKKQPKRLYVGIPFTKVLTK